MQDEDKAGQDLGADVAEEAEYEIEADETEDLDLAMREALQAVESGERVHDDPGQEDGEHAPIDSDDAVARLQAELADLRDRSVRTLADFDNYRKRVARERLDERRYAALELMREILLVVDNLERALSAEGSAEDLKTGVGMIHRQLLDLLRRYGLRQVPAVGEPFDPAVHEAVARVEDEETQVPTVSEEMQSGYLLHERLVRPAMVRVALPVERPVGDSQERESD